LQSLLRSCWNFSCFSALLFIILLLVGCTTAAGTVSVTSTTFPSPSETIHEPPQPTIKPASTATVQPTWTPVATLPVEIRKQNLIELFSTNGGCDFPCWWGISSGDSIQNVSELALVVGESLHIYRGFLYSYGLSLGDLDTPDLDVNYSVDANQIVQRIEISLNQPSRFWDYHEAFEERLSLAGVLGHYGKPSEILFLVTPRFEPGETPRPYTLFLIYDMQGFGIVYRGLVDSEKPLQVCSIKINDYRLQSISLYLQDPRSKIAEINRFNSTEFQPLEQVTSMSLDNFYGIFSEPEATQCIEISVDVWQ
jgi:hypothetical protein